VPAHRVTIADVAAMSGVSVATVSRALLDYPQVNAKTRERVAQAARALGYLPNRAARSLVLRATQTFGLLIPDATDPIHGQLVAGFEQEAAAAGYTVILANGFDSPERERRALETFVMHRADGIALIGSILSQPEARATVRPSPIVFVNGEHPSLAGNHSDLPTGCIRADDALGIDAAVAHLIEEGYRRFAYVGSPGYASDLTRRRAVARSLKRAGVVGRLQVYVSRAGAWEVEAGLAASIAGDRPDVVLCYDDKLALSLLNALGKLGVRVPQDVGVVGFDDIPFARLSSPGLTTIAQPAENLGSRAAAMLLDAIKTGTMARSARLPVTLIVRESTRPSGRTSGAAAQPDDRATRRITPPARGRSGAR
jgi:LacI family transcriptional regulator